MVIVYDENYHELATWPEDELLSASEVEQQLSKPKSSYERRPHI
jgi:hypothetical protein